MAVYVDDSRLAWRGKSWCHLVADSINELHTFAEQLGLNCAWFQDRTMYPHYDVTVKVKERALALGAYAGNKRTIISCAKRLKVELIASGHRNFLEVRTLSVDSRRVALLTRLDSPSQQVLFAA
jgi:Protein of unknown function (DUF4031)